ncbi:putative 3-ketoacyl-CoA synthase 20 [Acorus gramineus]|uniref:3-ketoacyl-CoA synthase n=1 Tax=Acorus gramineus TaxID=55184 RepID=A0AAV9BMX5_ACOGR|nr:putative 3-ketoacyl-CoA synthase 20 [Acorus gramineus]
MFELFKPPHLFILTTIAILSTLHLLIKKTLRRPKPTFLIDFSCYRPPDSHRIPPSTFLENSALSGAFDDVSLRFQSNILSKSGFGPETYIPASHFRIPINKSQTSAREESETVVFSVVADLLEKTRAQPAWVDAVIVNCSTYAPTPSLCAMIVNRFGMRADVATYNLSGMGCAAGLASVSLARDLLRTRARGTLALVVSTETLSLNWYGGADRSMLLPNCLFRVGASAALISSSADWPSLTIDRVDSHAAAEDGSPAVSVSKDIVRVAAGALRANLGALGPKVLPYTEQLRYALFARVPRFNRCFEHVCVHAGGRAVIEAVRESLRLGEEDVEASRMTLHRFGNTSSSSVWYELSYLETKGRVKKGDRVWQVAFGSGFKCNSVVWECVDDFTPSDRTAWSDRIDFYPLDVPHVIEDL